MYGLLTSWKSRSVAGAAIGFALWFALLSALMPNRAAAFEIALGGGFVWSLTFAYYYDADLYFGASAAGVLLTFLAFGWIFGVYHYFFMFIYFTVPIGACVFGLPYEALRNAVRKRMSARRQPVAAYGFTPADKVPEH